MTRVVLLALLAVAGCSTNHELSEARGPLFPLNDGRWPWTNADLVKPAAEASR